jgi:hypothetical protein
MATTIDTQFFVAPLRIRQRACELGLSLGRHTDRLGVGFLTDNDAVAYKPKRTAGAGVPL